MFSLYTVANRSVYTKAESMGVWIRLFEFVFENKIHRWKNVRNYVTNTAKNIKNNVANT